MADHDSRTSSLEPSVDAWALDVPEALEDEVSGVVWAAGCTGITIENASPGTLRLVCFFADPETHQGEMQNVALAFATTARRIQVPNPDWVLRFKETFVSFDAPPFRIVPEWIDSAAEAERATSIEGKTSRSHLNIRIDPGRAFGTGTHESTKLCLETLGAIAPTLPTSPCALDLGCGTGILGIAAVKIARARVVACDHDTLAAASAQRHASLNDVILNVLLTDGCRGLLPSQFDLVFANLMAPFLISRAAEITAVGSPGCRFILAGLLREEESAVKAAWPQGWKVAASCQGEWASLLYERP